jgi:hypothetical protein
VLLTLRQALESSARPQAELILQSPPEATVVASHWPLPFVWVALVRSNLARPRPTPLISRSPDLLYCTQAC